MMTGRFSPTSDRKTASPCWCIKHAASWLLCLMLVACGSGDQDTPDAQTTPPVTPPPADTPPAPLPLCEQQVTAIADIQGEGFASPLKGQQVTVRGIVTVTIAERGLFIQEAQPFSPGRRSHGLFVDAPQLASGSARGELLTLVGQIDELGEGGDTITSLTEIEQYENCGQGPEPPVFDARLPLTAAEREGFEAMQVLLEQPLTVTEVRDVSDGAITLSALGVLQAPTEIAMPGEEAAALARKNEKWSLPVHNPDLRRLDPYTDIQVGSVVNMVQGVLGHDGRTLRLLTQGDLAPLPQAAVPVPEAAEGDIRVASFNLYEYFNGDGKGAGFPGERGAQTAEEFLQQAARIAAAVKEMHPDVLGVMEVENDGFEATSAIQDLAIMLSEALGVPYKVAKPEAERAGTDVISVGLIYRSDRVAPHGPAHLLEGGSFGPTNRVPIAQVFRALEGGDRFLVVVNHLKSKGYCPESGPDTDQDDGQACWNAARVEGATETVRWAQQLAAEAGTENLLLLGDLNAYRMEDPIRALIDEGLVELVEHHQPGRPYYSYVFRGAAGTLDYAFASAPLAEISSDAFIWHINAAYPWSDRPSEPWLRSSDHDPVVVDLRFTQSETPD